MLVIEFYLAGVYFKQTLTLLELFEMFDSVRTDDLVICNYYGLEGSKLPCFKFNKAYDSHPGLSQGIYLVSIGEKDTKYTELCNVKNITNEDVLDVINVDYQYVVDYEVAYCM